MATKPGNTWCAKLPPILGGSSCSAALGLEEALAGLQPLQSAIQPAVLLRPPHVGAGTATGSCCCLAREQSSIEPLLATTARLALSWNGGGHSRTVARGTRKAAGAASAASTPHDLCLDGQPLGRVQYVAFESLRQEVQMLAAQELLLKGLLQPAPGRQLGGQTADCSLSAVANAQICARVGAFGPLPPHPVSEPRGSMHHSKAALTEETSRWAAGAAVVEVLAAGGPMLRRHFQALCRQLVAADHRTDGLRAHSRDFTSSEGISGQVPPVPPPGLAADPVLSGLLSPQQHSAAEEAQSMQGKLPEVPAHSRWRWLPTIATGFGLLLAGAGTIFCLAAMRHTISQGSTAGPADCLASAPSARLAC